ncbi:MAG: thiamine pyrophosphate-dependent enzyme, partial [Acidobacteriota bacterium]
MSPTPSPTPSGSPTETETPAQPETSAWPSRVDSLEELGLSREAVLRDYRIAHESREASLVGRREVLTGKAKFGIFGDGKEVAQLAMAHAFRKGDHRAGYYRDQTFMLALGEMSLREFFAQLYAHADVAAEPASAGRQMTAHFATRMLDEEGRFKSQTDVYNVPADLSPTGSQMPKLAGLAYASRLYRHLEELRDPSGGFERFSDGGNEVAWGTIGNASCAEGLFWETVNAVGVLKSPLLLSIWDDEYGISVPNEFQVTKGDVGCLLEGFRMDSGRCEEGGYDLYRVKGWDYPELVRTYLEAGEKVRRDHVPAIIHVVELTQPQGHSTSGSHERYKTEERLQWEEDHCCLKAMRQWILEQELAGADELDAIEKEARQHVLDEKLAAWKAFRAPIEEELETVVGLIRDLAAAVPGPGGRTAVEKVVQKLLRKQTPLRRDLLAAAEEALVAAAGDDVPARRELAAWRRALRRENRERYSSELYTESATGRSALDVPEVAPRYSEDAPTANGFEVLNHFFDAALARMPNVIAFGEDLGKLGDVNQGFHGLQEKYGALRVSDTGIREATIIGQAIGLALRGLRPIAEIQYLDYLLYCLQILSD